MRLPIDERVPSVLSCLNAHPEFISGFNRAVSSFMADCSRQEQ